MRLRTRVRFPPSPLIHPGPTIRDMFANPVPLERDLLRQGRHGFAGVSAETRAIESHASRRSAASGQSQPSRSVAGASDEHTLVSVSIAKRELRAAGTLAWVPGGRVLPTTRDASFHGRAGLGVDRSVGTTGGASGHPLRPRLSRAVRHLYGLGRAELPPIQRRIDRLTRGHPPPRELVTRDRRPPGPG
jgi:hypothetical protein